MHELKYGFLSILLLCGLFLLSCHTDTPEVENVHTSLDLIDRFPGGARINGEVSLDTMNLEKGGARSVISLSPGATVTFPVFLHANSRLVFEWGITRQKENSTDKEAVEHCIQIKVAGKTEEVILFRRALFPGKDKMNLWWTKEDMSLAAFSGQKVKLAFSMEGDPASGLVCGWANPEILSKGKAAALRGENPGNNLVLISVDTLRADHLQCYGYPRETSPALNRLAAGGVLFENAFSQAYWTLPSHISLLTSLYPDAHGVPSKSTQKLLEGTPTLASILKSAGYKTGGFARESGNMSPEYGFGYGFDQYSLRYQDIHGFNRRVARWLEDTGGHRFFLFLHLFDPHSDTGMLPYEGPAEYMAAFASGRKTDFQGCKKGLCGSLFLESVNRGENRVTDEEIAYMRNLYDAGVLLADDHLAYLIKTLERLELLDKTLIVFTADHGEEFMEHGKLLHSQFYNECVHVPLVFYFPAGGIPQGKRVRDLVENVDVMPTILDLFGIHYEGDLQGRSLTPFFRGQALAEKVIYGAATNVPSKMVRTGPWKLVIREDGSRELFNLVEDPDEKHNLAKKQTAIFLRLAEIANKKSRENAGLFDRLFGEYTAETSSNRVALSKAEKQNLRALGYLEEGP